MLVKCETKSNRVKGLSFHPKLSWILASLHNGVIQLWDYRIGSLIDKFEEHEGPVRGVDFHSSQPLFVSGGDDYRLKVWNYRTRKCIFTLIGHLDYIRTVQFHSNYPWILSASDDQTIRIWNWQSRNCIAVLTGHNHYVMSAQFHPTEDLLVSGSLDQTIRIWDVCGLREKTVSMSSASSACGAVVGIGGGLKTGLISQHASSHVDMFGTSDCVCKYILEGHDRGVNWVCFHPTLPLVASAADDRLIKLWRYNDMKAWEVDSLRGHFNNVSCVIFHPKKDVLISNSEDKTIRVWDASKRIALHTFRRDSDRFWMLTAHLNSNLIAVGHDSGMVVFKLDRERPPMHCFGNMLFHVKDKSIQLYNCDSNFFSSSSSTCSPINICPARRALNALNGNVVSLIFNTLNTTEINLIVFYNEVFEDGSHLSYDIISCPNPKNESINSSLVTNKTGGSCNGAVFTSRNRVCVFEKASNTLCIYTLNLELTKRIEPSFQVDAIFSAYNNRIVLKCDEKAILYDLASRKVINEVSCPSGLRCCIWSEDYQLAALLAKHHVTLVNKKFDYIFSFHENIRVKSGAWDDNGIFIYTTLSHVKYCLQNGDQGIIHSLLDPIYIARVHKQKMIYINRNMAVCTETLNGNEYLFKLALQKRQFDLVNLLIKNGELCGNAVIGYLKSNGYAEVAMKFVENPKTKFNLALDFGHLHHAIKAAQLIDDKSMWDRLGKVSLSQGNYQIVETSYQKLKKFEKLSFFYLISGNFNKLRKMLKIADLRKDVMSRFHNALMLGDVEERVRILGEAGQVPLAYLLADIHKLDDLSKTLKESIQHVETENILPKSPKLFIPPITINPVVNSESANWPMKNIQNVLGGNNNIKKTNVQKSENVVGMTNAKEMSANANECRGGVLAEEDCWTDDAVLESEGKRTPGDTNVDSDLLEEDRSSKKRSLWAADTLDDILLENFEDNEDNVVNIQNNTNCVANDEVSSCGHKPEDVWLKNQPLVYDYICAGKFSEALQILQRRIGLINAIPLKKVFLHIYTSTWLSLPNLPQLPSIPLPLLDKNFKMNEKVHKPHRLYDCNVFSERIKIAYKHVTGGRFNEALESFRETLQFLSIAVCDTLEEEKTLREYIEICREYVIAMKIEFERSKLTEDSQISRNIELVSYFTCCKLLPCHLFLVLRRAMAVAYKAENYITTASFARRLIEGNFGSSKAPEDIARARKVLLFAENKGTDAHDIDFDPFEYEGLKICSLSFSRIRLDDATVKCAFCEAVVKKKFSSKLCPICNLAELGARVLGVQFRVV